MLTGQSNPGGSWWNGTWNTHTDPECICIIKTSGDKTCEPGVPSGVASFDTTVTCHPRD